MNMASSLTVSQDRSNYRTMDDLPGSYGIPVFGESLRVMMNPRLFTVQRLTLAAKEGLKLFKSNMFGRKLIMVADPDLIDYLLKKENKLITSRWLNHHIPLFGEESIFVVTHERHTLVRRLFEKAFEPNAMQHAFPSVVTSVRSNLLEWCNNGVTDMLAETKRLTFGLAMNLLVGSGRLSSEELNELRTQYHRSLTARETLMSKLRDIVDAILKEEEIGVVGNEVDNGSLTKILISGFNYEVGESMDADQIAQNLLILLFAGGDTSSIVMVLFLIILQNRPDVLAKLEREQQEFIQVNGEAYTKDQLMKGMPYTAAVLNETLRVIPIVTGVQRVAVQDFVLPGTDILVREGDGLTLSYIAGHYDEKVEELTSPLERLISKANFDPDRLYERMQNGEKENKPFFGFGGGPRVCLGRPLAEIESRVFLVELVRNFDFQLPADRLYPELSKLIFPTPVKPLPVTFTQKSVTE